LSWLPRPQRRFSFQGAAGHFLWSMQKVCNAMDERSHNALRSYRDKRNFDITPKPAAGGVANERERCFVIQKHGATRLHSDLRLELDGSMKSWAVPKGPSFDPA